MPGERGRTAARGQPSRKGKKAWRKHVDVGEVEEQLDEQRTEERLGGRLHEVADEQLYFTDKAGTLAAPGRPRVAAGGPRLKMDAILAASNPSAVRGVVSSAKRPSTIALGPEATGTKARKVSKSLHLRIAALAKRKRAEGVVVGHYAQQKQQEREARQAALATAQGGYDLWASSPAAAASGPGATSFVDPMPARPKAPKLPVPAATKALPAVPVTHAGTSYNPTFGDHQAVLQLALDVEVDKAERLQKLKAATPRGCHGRRGGATMDVEEETFFEDSSDEEDADEEEEGGEGRNRSATDRKELDAATAPTKRAGRKTKAERNRKLKAREQALREAKMAQAKRIHKEINKIGEFERELQAARAKSEEQAAARAARAPSTEKLGPHAYRPASLPIQLTEELVDSLRELRPEGNLFQDRFSSLQARQLIEVRVPIKQRRKFALKQVETHDYKRFV